MKKFIYFILLFFTVIGFADDNSITIIFKDGGETVYKTKELLSISFPTEHSIVIKSSSISEHKIFDVKKMTFSPVITGVVEWNNKVPKDFVTAQNYPNPFNPSTTIEFTIPDNGFVNVKIFNLFGQQVRAFDSSFYFSGIHSLKWNGVDDSGNFVASGVYFYRITHNNFSLTKQMILNK